MPLIFTQVDGEVDKRHVDILVHGDGLPGGLVLVRVDVSQVGGVVGLMSQFIKYQPQCFLKVLTFVASYASQI